MAGPGLAKSLHAVRILIVKLSAIGDVVHTLPALTTLRRHRPDAQIHWLVESAGGELIENHPALSRRIVLPRQEWRQRSQGGRWFAAARHFMGFARGFRRESYDLAVDFQGLAKSAIWIAMARARRKAGFGSGMQRNEGAWLPLNQRVPAVSPDMHALDRGLHLLEALGFSRLPLRYDLEPGDRAVSEVAPLLREVGVEPGRPFVAVNPVTRWPTKDWEPTRFAAVADQLEQAGWPAVFTGAPGDREAISAIAGRMTTKARRLEGRTRLAGLAELCRRARVMLTTDTGPMHIAAAMGTPVVALFGPTAPWRTGPYGEGHVVLRTGLDCSPCYKRRCGTDRYEPHACMLRLEPGAVVDAVLRMVNRV